MCVLLIIPNTAYYESYPYIPNHTTILPILLYIHTHTTHTHIHTHNIHDTQSYSYDYYHYPYTHTTHTHTPYPILHNHTQYCILPNHTQHSFIVSFFVTFLHFSSLFPSFSSSLLPFPIYNHPPLIPSYLLETLRLEMPRKKLCIPLIHRKKLHQPILHLPPPQLRSQRFNTLFIGKCAKHNSDSGK